MRPKHLPIVAAGAVFAAVLGMTPASAAYVQTDCPAESDWFPHATTPIPPFDTFQSTSNCVFHQWSWQAFLWLTQNDPKTGKPRFLSFASPSDLFSDDGYTQGLMPRMGKSSVAETIDEYLQAGTDGILTDQTGRAVYYSQYLDPVFAAFVKKNNLTDPTAFAAFDANTPFPNGTMELKASWKVVHPGDDVSGFFTMPAIVNLLANKNGQIVIDPSQTQEVTLALVGFHIGGRVDGHPEMIWATFEHKDNAPNVPAMPTPDTVISNQDWTFYKAGTPYKGCNLNPANSPDLKLDEATQTLSPITQVCRLFEYGNNPVEPADRIERMAENDSNIKQLNDDVRPKLAAEGGVWGNYFEVGAIWFGSENALKPDDALATDDLLTGSLKLSNATIETFTQTQSAMNNCFRCHNTLHRFPPKPTMNPLPGKDLNISHIMVNGYFWEQDQAAQDAADKAKKD